MSTVVEESEPVDRREAHAARIDRELEIQRQQIVELVGRMRRVRMLSTLPYHKVAFWMDNVESVLAVPGPLWRRMKSPLGILDPWMIPRLWWRAPRYDLMLISGGERAELIYLALAALTPWIRTPHVVITAHWQPDTGISGVIQRLILRLGNRLLMQIQPHSEEEIGIYNKNFGIPAEKIVPIPWSTSLIGYNLRPAKGDFVLTGGLSYRDYRTFFTAVRDLRVPVEVGLPAEYRAPEVELVRGADHVTVHTTLNNRQYMEKMATCRVFALPVTPGLERSTGDRTILNAMYLRKIVVATDSIGPRLYIRHGKNGFLVPEGDVAAWRDTIERIYAMSEEEYETMADEAEYDAKVLFSEEMRLYRTLDVVLNELEGRAGAGRA